jgi:hypothetical protein
VDPSLVASPSTYTLQPSPSMVEKRPASTFTLVVPAATGAMAKPTGAMAPAPAAWSARAWGPGWATSTAQAPATVPPAPVTPPRLTTKAW